MVIRTSTKLTARRASGVSDLDAEVLRGKAPLPTPPSPLASVDVLDRWAEAERLTDLALQPARGLQVANTERMWLQQHGFRWTLRDLLTRPTAAPSRSPGVAPPRSLAEAALRWLQDAAHADGDAAKAWRHARKLAEGNRPQGRRGRAMDALLAEEGRLAPLAQHIASLGTWQIHLTAAKGGLGFDATVYGATCASPAQVQVRLDEALQVASARCACMDSPDRRAVCAAARRALQLIAVELARSGSAFDAIFREVLDVVPWQQTLALLGQAAPQAQPDEALALGWRLTLEPSFDCKPVRLHAAKRGGGFRVKVLKLEEALEAEGLATPTDLQIALALLAASGANRYGQLGRVDALQGQALRLLAGHPYVFLERETLPTPVVGAELALTIQGRDDGGFVLGAALDGEPADVGALAKAVSITRGAALLADSLVAAGGISVVLRLQVAAVPTALANFLRRLASHGGAIPSEAAVALRQTIAAVAPVVSIVADARVLGSPQPSDPSPVLQLSLADGRDAEAGSRLKDVTDASLTTVLAVGIRAQPLPDGPVLHPGLGNALVFGRGKGDGDASHAHRDLAAEKQAAEALRQALGLADGWDHMVRGEAALDLIARLIDQPDVRVLWDARPPRLHRVKASQMRILVSSRIDWLSLGGEVVIDNERISLQTVLAALRAGRRWIAVGGDRWVRIEAEVEAALTGLALRGEASPEGERVPVLAGALVDELATLGAKVQGDTAWTARSAQANHQGSATQPLPAGLTAELRAYQAHGFRWLHGMAAWAPGALLADDMGLGKTVQALAMLVARAGEGPAMVVAPTSLGFAWLREGARFAPGLRLLSYRGATRAGLLRRLGKRDVLVTSYDLLHRDIDALADLPFATVVLDEAQALKNPESQRARAAARLRAAFRIGLSGTPVENRASELWSVLRAVVPGLLPGWQRFRDQYALPIERDRSEHARTALARLVGPFVLRRRKADVLPDLPARVEMRLDVVLSAGERALYDQIRAASLHALAQGSVHERRIAVLAALTRLRQAACHPQLVAPDVELPSAKLAALRAMITELRAEGQRVLVFSQFVRQLDLIRAALVHDGASVLQLDGSTAASRRSSLVDAFQRGEADVMLLSLKAGGTGLNLTAATTVVLMDPWWNPAVEAQAGDRAHRIGQHHSVTIVRLVALGTVEDAILGMQADKRELTEALLAGADASTAFDTNALVDLIAAEASDGGDAEMATEAEADLGDDSGDEALEDTALRLRDRAAQARAAAAAAVQALGGQMWAGALAELAEEGGGPTPEAAQAGEGDVWSPRASSAAAEGALAPREAPSATPTAEMAATPATPTAGGPRRGTGAEAEPATGRDAAGPARGVAGTEALWTEILAALQRGPAVRRGRPSKTPHQGSLVDPTARFLLWLTAQGLVPALQDMDSAAAEWELLAQANLYGQACQRSEAGTAREDAKIATKLARPVLLGMIAMHERERSR